MRYPQGRLLFPATGAFAIVLAVGLTNWLPRRWQSEGVAALTALYLGLALLAPFAWLAPAYAPSPATAVPGQITPVDIAFDDQLQLTGYQLGASELHPGNVLPLTLFWQTGAPITPDYSIFIHLTDENDILQAQRDSFPDKGNLPHQPVATRCANRGSTLSHRAANGAPRRHACALTWAYMSMPQARLPVGDADFWTLGYISLLPQTGRGAYPNSLFVNFDQQIALVGFAFDRRTMRPGETLTLSLWWEALTTTPIDYKVFTHLVLPPEATWAQMDSDRSAAAAKTSTWQTGQQIEDTYELTLPTSAPAGVYFVEIGLYDPDTNDRLKVNFSDKGVVLGQVKVVSE